MQANIHHKRALEKLDASWKSAYELKEPLYVLNDLVRSRLAKRRVVCDRAEFPGNNILFKRETKHKGEIT